MNRALTIGINYPGSDFALRGCVNDANDWSDFFKSNQFTVTQLLDAQATKAAILAEMTTLITGLVKGETGAIAYSGHGTWMPCATETEPDGRLEAICPADMGDDGANLITGPEFHALFDRIPTGATVVFLTDCCHSGTVFRFAPDFGVSSRKVRFIPPSHILKDPVLITQMNLAFGQPSRNQKPPLPGLVHYSGCKDEEYSADACFGGRFSGAFTYFAIRAMGMAAGARGTYLDVWHAIRQYLPNAEYTQTPCFNAMPALRSRRVLS